MHRDFAKTEGRLCWALSQAWWKPACRQTWACCDESFCRARVNRYHSCDPAGGCRRSCYLELAGNWPSDREGVIGRVFHTLLHMFSRGECSNIGCHGFLQHLMALKHRLCFNSSLQCHRMVWSTRCLDVITNISILKLKRGHLQELCVPMKIRMTILIYVNTNLNT